ncbi:peroxide stress protein YaaA [Akkermansiaceae bacterium]|nr:peroxide stress protein YaaA [Akkermansiaceae bacterium]
MMIFLLSPAKTLDYTTPLPEVIPTEPSFLDQSQELIDLLKNLSSSDISELMSLSEKLASLNEERYQTWDRKHELSEDCRPALLSFKGDVYQGLDAYSFSVEELHYAQQHLRILSGLYGILKPLDLMRPYRLEMGTKLTNPNGKNLYSYWGDSITEHLNDTTFSPDSKTIVNLASNEYFSAINTKLLKHEVITPVFKDYKNGKYKIISFYAKKARGTMAAWALKNKIESPEEISKFDLDGYHFSAEDSSAKEIVFLRRQEN